MNRFNIAQKMQVARDLLYEAYTASYRNDLTDYQFRHFVGKDLPRIINHLQKVQLLLLKDESKQPQPPDFANTMLGEVPHGVNAQSEDTTQAVEGATTVVRQNEQTKEVCHCIWPIRDTNDPDLCAYCLKEFVG